jgi:hypothetical protein
MRVGSGVVFSGVMVVLAACSGHTDVDNAPATAGSGGRAASGGAGNSVAASANSAGAASGGSAGESGASHAGSGGASHAGASAGGASHAGAGPGGAGDAGAGGDASHADAGAGGASTSDAGAAGAADENLPACVVTLFNGTCAGSLCHTGPSGSGGLDLTSPGVASRLVDRSVQFPGLAPGATGCPTAAKLIDTSDRSASWLLLKVIGPIGGCGALMPPIGTLSVDDRTCLQAWVDSVPASSR